jgi:hypothetical protein
VLADLPQQAGFPKGAATGEVGIGQGTHSLGDDPAEPPHLSDQCLVPDPTGILTILCPKCLSREPVTRSAS